MDNIKCLYETEVVCPYCGDIKSDSCEYFYSDYNHDATIWCEECEKEFNVCRDISVTYSSYKLKE